jgi:superfamily II DNA or RNA helicase
MAWHGTAGPGQARQGGAGRGKAWHGEVSTIQRRTTVELRPYQKEALQAVVENLDAGIHQQMLVLATGLGKTVIAAQLPALLKNRLPGKLLFVAHRNELITQAVDKIGQWNPTLKIGVEKAESHASPDCDIIIACNASIGRKGSTRMDDFWKDISIIVIDEVHHAVADSYMNILEDSGILLPDNKKLLIGLTATPKRHSKKRTSQSPLLDDEDLVSLKSIFKKIVYNYPLRKGIKDGYLAPLHGFRLQTATNLDEVKVVAGDFQVDALSTAVNTPERNTQVVKAWKENAAGRPTLCFTVDVQHAKDLAEAFLHNGVLAQPIYGDDPQRKEKLAWFEKGQVTVLCNCALLTEGFDSPSVQCIVLARPTRSGTLYTQMIGRGTRLNKGKENCYVIDIADNYKKCSLVTLPSLVGLNPLMDLHGTSLVKAAEKMEALQEQYPTLPLRHITDINGVNAYIEKLDLFSNPYDEEVKEYSTLTWMTAADDSYVLQIPEREDLQQKKAFERYLHEKLHIVQNELGEWELSITSVNTDKQLATYNTLKEAFESADEVIRRCRGDRLELLRRNSPWHSQPASEAAKKFLRTLSRTRPMLKCICPGIRTEKICPVCRLATGITAGEASLAINLLKARRK